MEKLYYKEKQVVFEQILHGMKQNPNTIHFFSWSDNPYYYLPDPESAAIVLRLHEDQWKFDALFQQFSDFGKKQILQSILINEIYSTNEMEQVFSTRHDIFTVLEHCSKSDNPKIISIVNGYEYLLRNEMTGFHTLQDIRDIYDAVLLDTLDNRDLPDGTYFRKEPVQVTDGIKTIHTGLYPEAHINQGMQEYLDIIHEKKLDIYERTILGHFILESVHPYYDGNGRLGRFLMTTGLHKETGSYSSFLISTALNHNKSKYYKAFVDAQKPHQFGFLNQYVVEIGELLHQEYQKQIHYLQTQKEKLENLVFDEKEFTKSERKILKLLAEGALLSLYGPSNQEIMNYTSLSKRTVITAMNKFHRMNLLDDTKIGKINFHKLCM